MQTRLTSKVQKKTLLCPLSGGEGLSVRPAETIDLWCRDIKKVMSIIGARNVHLRLHPDFSASRGWAPQLQAKLNQEGVKSQIVPCSLPIQDIICDYLGVAGFGSGALREARASCYNVQIFGFESVSLDYFAIPQLVFGASEGIAWLDAEGELVKDASWNPDIMKTRQSIPDLLMELTGVN